MSEAFHERRRTRPFRILYMSLEAFLRRIILRGGDDIAVAHPDALAIQAPALGGEKAIPWKCGVARLDNQNEALFKAIRQYQTALKTGAGLSAMDEVLSFLEGHMDGHLSLEEAYLEHIHFPSLAEHRQGHLFFQQQIHAFRHRLADGDLGAGLELSQVLYTWMRVHVLKEDMVWGEFAKSRRRP